MGLTVPGVDYAWDKPDPAALHKDGVRFAMRYLSHDPSKNLTAGELKSLHAHGIAVGLVWESTAGRARDGRAAGVADAKTAAAQAANLGLGKIPIYFAVDFDATDAQKPVIAAYLKGAADAIGHDRVGVYGGYHVVKYMAANHVCRWFWQTYAWSGGLVHPSAHIYQHRNGVQQHGGTYDLNKATDKGGFGVAEAHTRKPVSPLQKLRWRSNVKVLRRIIENHPGWPHDKLAALRWVLEKYERAIKRGTL